MPTYIDEQGQETDKPVAVPTFTLYVKVGAKRIPVSYRVNEDGCWICTSHGRGGSCYPRVGGKGKDSILIFKALWIEKFGPIPKDKILMTTCTECWQKCINPDHRIVATHADVAYEKMIPGRVLDGGGHFSSKLNPKKALKIAALKGVRSADSIAKEVGCSSQAIYRLWRGESWNHVTGIQSNNDSRILKVDRCTNCPCHVHMKKKVKNAAADYCSRYNQFFSPNDGKKEFPTWCRLKKKPSRRVKK